MTSVDPEDAKEEVEVMRALDDRVGKWNDVTLAALLMARGKSVAPWADLKQGNHPPHETALTHDDKRFYGKRMAEDERGMCAPPRTKDEDEELARSRRVKSVASPAANSATPASAAGSRHPRRHPRPGPPGRRPTRRRRVRRSARSFPRRTS